MTELRLDALLVEKGLVASRTLAQKLISGKYVYVKRASLWVCETKPSKKYTPETEIKIEENDEQRFVSRAGLKLEGALIEANMDVVGKRILDVGQSTGGFTDCLIQKGADSVIGIDVGRDQLSSELRDNPKVICLEQINARNLSFDYFQGIAEVKFPFIVMDVSFISQTHILPRLVECLAENGRILSLVKPQFEVGPEGIGKGGLVKSQELYKDVQKTVTECATINGLRVEKYFESKITGGDGNREFFMVASKPPSQSMVE